MRLTRIRLTRITRPVTEPEIVEGTQQVNHPSGAVVARGMSDRYGRTEVLRAIDLDVTTGATALLGPNGAGKTTLLQLICGLRTPVSGSLDVMGVSEGDSRRRETIAGLVGFLPQNFGYLPSYTVRDFVTYAAWLKKVPKAELAGRVRIALTDVDMLDRANQKLKTLSGGMVRRVGIATAIVHRPSLVILDEPSAGLDPAQRRDLRALIATLARTSSVIVSTHLTDDVRSNFSHVVVLEDGGVRFTGTPAELERCSDRRDGAEPSIEDGYLAVLTSGRVAA